MKKFLLVCVTYNSYSELGEYLASVDVALGRANDEWEVDVLVGDNTVENVQAVQFSPGFIRSFRVFSYKKNYGYFGAAQRAMMEVGDVRQYDYVAISNVDLYMPDDFFVKLGQLSLSQDVGWVANAIISGYEKRDRNPKIIHRYSVGRLKQLRFLFHYPLFHYLYTKTLYRRKKAQSARHAMPVYAGHGSFILLTKAFFSACPKLEYPMFLFCEEIYLGEICREANLKVWYEPSLVIRDTEHCSTGKMKKSFYYRCNYDALNYILSRYYR